MSLRAGTSIGRYQIETAIGAGGMGEVYKARDTSLNRHVAIKILPPHLGTDPQRRRRFNREAQAIAALVHPHICTLYDFGEADGVAYLVMEYVEGETLAQRLGRLQPSLEQAVAWGVEIAEALDAAHKRRIVHRDLKPSNIMVTEGGIKLLDFGLAKFESPDPADLSVTLAAQAAGAQQSLLGTPQYMAPEQVEGKTVDHRADIFALGAIVYEMVSGKKAFTGESQAGLISAILRSEPPPLSLLARRVPPALDRAIAKCLVKDPEGRWQTARDFGDELKWITHPPRARRLGFPVRTSIVRAKHLALAAILLAAVAGLVSWRESLPGTIPHDWVARSVMSMAPSERYAGFFDNNIAISRDGRHVVFTGMQNGHTRLFDRAIDRLEAVAIPGTEDAIAPFFSPDGVWLGFLRQDRQGIWKVSLDGGPPQLVWQGNVGSASWGADGSILFMRRSDAGLSKIPASGGPPQPVSAPDRSRRERGHRRGQILPGGTTAIFSAESADMRADGEARIEAVSLATGQRRVLIQGGTSARYAPTGHLVYVRGDTLLAVPFDAQRLEVTGPPVPVATGLATEVEGTAQYDFSDNGTLVYVAGADQTVNGRLIWVDRRGRTEIITDVERPFDSIQLSPDGRRLALGIAAANDEVWIYDLARTTLTPLVLGWSNVWPIWTPDGLHVTFASDRLGGARPFWIAADGSGAPEPLWSRNAYGMSWSPDGRVLAARVRDDATHRCSITLLPADGHRAVQSFLEGACWLDEPAFSPDGRWLAYVSDESGRPEVYVQAFPGAGDKWQISTAGGVDPLWSRAGTEIYYRDAPRSGDDATSNVAGFVRGRTRVMAVPIEHGGRFSAGRPKVLFEIPDVARGTFSYDVAADGRRFVMIQSAGWKPAPTQITVVQNWFDELRRRVPPGR